MANYDYARHIVHVHGKYDDPANIVLTKLEYDSFYARVPVARKFWEIVPVVRRCVFLGFSFSDPELTEKFNLRELHSAHSETQAFGHFAVLAINDSEMETALRAEYTAEYGVESVFYDPIDAKYTGYSNVVQKMANELRAPVEQPMVSMPAVFPVEIINNQQQQEEPVAAGDSPAMDLAAISADLEHLERLTADNLRKRSTGDLQ
jgi:hypothetical protein